MKRVLTIWAALFALVPGLFAQTNWQEALAAMPLPGAVSNLDRGNCIRMMLHAFRRNPAVKALIFMPGATDEFYFFRRAHAKLSNAAPSLLDAVAALTNQTYVRVAWRPPFLLLHGVEDPLEPAIVVESQATAEALRSRPFESAIFNDCDWDAVQPVLTRDLGVAMSPPAFTPASFHFFRNSFAEFDLTGWEALEAVAMASKTRFTVKDGLAVFEGDDRPMPKPVPPDPAVVFKNWP